MDKLRDKITGDIDSLIQHLDKYEEKRWSAYFRNIRALIVNGDGKAIESLGKIRGGMGSFNDLVICRMNGHKIGQHEESFANSELARLGSQVFESADKLKRLMK